MALKDLEILTVNIGVKNADSNELKTIISVTIHTLY